MVSGRFANGQFANVSGRFANVLLPFRPRLEVSLPTVFPLHLIFDILCVLNDRYGFPLYTFENSVLIVVTTVPEPSMRFICFITFYLRGSHIFLLHFGEFQIYTF